MRCRAPVVLGHCGTLHSASASHGRCADPARWNRFHASHPICQRRTSVCAHFDHHHTGNAALIDGSPSRPGLRKESHISSVGQWSCNLDKMACPEKHFRGGLHTRQASQRCHSGVRIRCPARGASSTWPPVLSGDGENKQNTCAGSVTTRKRMRCHPLEPVAWAAVAAIVDTGCHDERQGRSAVQRRFQQLGRCASLCSTKSRSHCLSASTSHGLS